MAGAVGQDALADTALAGLAAAGVDLSRVARGGAPTGCASICTDAAGHEQRVLHGGGAGVRTVQGDRLALLRAGRLTSYASKEAFVTDPETGAAAERAFWTAL